MNVAEEKTRLRRQQLLALREISVSQRAEWSAEIVSRLQQTAAWQQAEVVMIYAPLPNEPNLLPLLTSGKQLIFPKVTPQGLTLHRVSDATQLTKTSGWLSEPDASCPEVDLAKIDLVCLPGLAFSSATGTRLGRGGGYYDRLLSRDDFRAMTIGVCFEIQVLDTLPQEAHDLCVQEIVTESCRHHSA